MYFWLIIARNERIQTASCMKFPASLLRANNRNQSPQLPENGRTQSRIGFGIYSWIINGVWNCCIMCCYVLYNVLAIDELFSIIILKL